LHFRMNRRDVARAPKVVDVPQMPKVQAHKVALTKDAIARLAHKMRKFAAMVSKRHDHLEAEELNVKDILLAVRAIPSGFAYKTDERVFDQITNFEYNLFAEDLVKLKHKDLEVLSKVLPSMSYALLLLPTQTNN